MIAHVGMVCSHVATARKEMSNKFMRFLDLHVYICMNRYLLRSIYLIFSIHITRVYHNVYICLYAYRYLRLYLSFHLRLLVHSPHRNSYLNLTYKYMNNKLTPFYAPQKSIVLQIQPLYINTTKIWKYVHIHVYAYSFLLSTCMCMYTIMERC